MKQYVVEAFGTFFLVLAIALTHGTALAPIAIGLMLMALVFIGGHISGAHYNPAVTLAICLKNKHHEFNGALYVASQFIGAALATLTYQALTGHIWAPISAIGVSLPQAILIEALLTSILCGVILTVTSTKPFTNNHIYALAIGLTLTAIASVGGSISGGAFNPAVGIIPIIIKAIQGYGLDLTHLIIYSVGPLLGAIIAAAYIRYFNNSDNLV